MKDKEIQEILKKQLLKLYVDEKDIIVFDDLLNDKKIIINNLYEQIHFDKWHLFIFEERPYAIGVCEYVNGLGLKGKIVELGCGIGDLLQNIDGDIVGYDREQTALDAANNLFPNIKFKEGSFEEIDEGTIDVLIMVNFLNATDEKTILEGIETVLNNNKVERFIVDKVESPMYEYNHNFERIFDKFGYECCYQSKEFAVKCGTRWIQCYSMKK